MPQLSAIGALAKAETRKEFADELAKYTSLNAQEMQSLFPQKADQDELIALLEIVHGATSDNEKKAQLVERIGNVAGAIVKITKRFATGLG